jgi:transposase
MVDGALAGPSSKAQSEQRTIVWVDEAGFYLLPGLVRTYAPRGQPPILRVPCTRDHLSVISGLTHTGRLLVQKRRQAFRGPAVVGFLQHLLHHIDGKLLVLWDGAPIHRAQPVKDFLAQGAAARLQLEQLPGYAPDLNPDEGVWHYLKHVELRNICCADLDELAVELELAVRRLRRKAHVLRGCIAECGYTITSALDPAPLLAADSAHPPTTYPEAA